MVNGKADIITGKIPPQSRSLEEAILGACMLDRGCIGKAASFLTPDSFYVPAHVLIFTAIIKLYNSGNPVDSITVSDYLRSMGKLEEVGGAYYVSKLGDDNYNTASVEYNAAIVAQKFIQREIIRISSEAIKRSYEDTADVFELLDSLTVSLIKITAHITKNNAQHISDAAHKNYVRIEKMSADPGRLLGYSTGLSDLDKATHGIQPGVINIAARPSMGKSALLGQIITKVAQQGVPCQVFTMEVNASKYEMRMKTQLSGIHFERIQTGNIYANEWELLERVTTQIADLPIWIDEAATLSQVQLRSKCLQAYNDKGVRLFALDYIQLGDGGHENEGLTLLSRTVKIISQELNVPFIVLSQLSREVEKRTDKKPMLSDLRSSGSLEQDADVVMLLYRPEYYGIEAMDSNQRPVNKEGFAQLRVAKNKDGKVMTIDLNFKGDNLLFSDYINSNTPF